MSKVKLYCLPPAGMSAVSYNAWQCYMRDFIDVFPIELAGRGIRYKDGLYLDSDNAVNDIYEIIKNKIDDQDYAIFGHCMGSWLAYELCRKLIFLGHRKPVHVIFSGKEAPHIKNDKSIHNLPDKEFIEEIIKLGGTSEDFFEDDNMVKMFMPVLRNDFRIIENYRCPENKGKLPFAISVFYGKDDTKLKTSLHEWKSYSDISCNFYEFEGEHFFPDIEKVIETINEILSDE